MNIKINLKFLLLFGIFLVSSIVWNTVQAQIAPDTGISIKINTPVNSANVPIGDLTIHGTSSDDDTTNCQVYADWNDLKPMQNVTPGGSKGNADYSSWSFTYTGSYHNIVEGPNELTSKISCYDQGQNASSKFYSVNVTGATEGNENTNKTEESDENTDNDVSTVLPVKNNNSNGTYKILPLYSESNEESIHAVASQDSDKTEQVTSTDTSESQDSEELNDTDTNTYFTYESEQQEETGQTTTTDMSESQFIDSADEAASTDTNTYFTFESEQEEGEELSANNGNTISNSPQSDNPLPNYYHDDGNSVFGLNFKDLDEDTKNKLENRMEKLKERIADRMPLFDLIG